MTRGDPIDSAGVISSFRDSLDVLFRARLIDPPRHPGLLAALDDYDILRVLGMGGMGIVLLGKQRAKMDSAEEFFPDSEASSQSPSDSTGAALPDAASDLVIGTLPAETGRHSPHHLFAIKLLRQELLGNAKEVRRFLTEAQHMQGLSHANILKVLTVSNQALTAPAASSNSVGLERGSCPVLKPKRPYYVMPYVTGGSLATMIRERGPLPADLALSLSLQIASALGYVHERGIIHRDLKPGNILLDEGGRVYLTDFGLSRTMVNDASVDVRVSQRVGTAYYMSPAVAAGEAEDTRCDIYSFGAVLYEMLTGQPPYHGASIADLPAIVQNSNPKPISALNPYASRALAKIAERAMARKLSDRYAQMSTVVEELERIKQKSAGRKTSGGRLPAWRESLYQWMRKPGIAFGGLVAIAALVAAIAGWVLFHPVLHETSAMTLPGILSWRQAQLGDWYGDGRRQVFLAYNNQLVVVSDQGTECRQGIAEVGSRDLALDLVLPVDAERGDDVFIHWRTGTNLFIGVWNRDSSSPIRRFQAAEPPLSQSGNPQAHSALVAKKVVPADEGGRRRLLAAIYTEFARHPQSLCCYDLDSEQLLWKFHAEAAVGRVDVLPGASFGAATVIFGSQALDAGAANSGTHAHSCLAALSAKTGELLWSRDSGGAHTTTSFALSDLRGKGATGILAWVTADSPVKRPATPGAGQVTEFDVQGNALATFDAGPRLQDCSVVDLNRDGKQEIVMTDTLGNITLLNDQFAVLDKAHVFSSPVEPILLRLAAARDLDGDGVPELVFRCSRCQIPTEGADDTSLTAPVLYHENSILVLSSKLNIMAQYPIRQNFSEPEGFAAQVDDWDRDCTPEIFCFSDQLRTLRFLKRAGALVFR